MSYQQRDNSGSLFVNDDKRPDKVDPDLRGSIMVAGVKYWISAWTKPPTGKIDKKWLSLAVRAAEPTGPAKDYPDEGLPF